MSVWLSIFFYLIKNQIVIRTQEYKLDKKHKNLKKIENFEHFFLEFSEKLNSFIRLSQNILIKTLKFNYVHTFEVDGIQELNTLHKFKLVSVEVKLRSI